MTIDRVEVKQGDFRANNAALIENTHGACIVHGNITFVQSDLVDHLLNAEEAFTGFELYECGAFNLFVRKHGATSAHAYVRIRL